MKRASRTTITVLLLTLLLACGPGANEDLSSEGTPRPFTVAFIGDQGTGQNARAVLQLIRAEGAELVLHQGDLGYDEPPEEWDALITDVIGADFPYFATIGNHDVERWYGADGYQALLQARLDRIESARCRGDLGVEAACSYRETASIMSRSGCSGSSPRMAKGVG
jgi:3',5'-cyclic AMP phosphodiesterase CpdA